jgi:hypothetical protein
MHLILNASKACIQAIFFICFSKSDAKVPYYKQEQQSANGKPTNQQASVVGNW